LHGRGHNTALRGHAVLEDVNCHNRNDTDNGATDAVEKSC
jgi:hypothetical protein